MKGSGISRRISARPGSPWRRNPDAVKLAVALRAHAIVTARRARAAELALQAQLARERMHRRH